MAATRRKTRGRENMKFLLGALSILVLLCSFLGYKTYDLSKDKATLGVALTSAQEALKATENAREKDKQSCSLTDLINTEYQEQKQERSDKKDKILDELNKLEAKSTTKPKQEDPINEQSTKSLESSEAVNIDAKLPDDLRMLLDKACNPSKDGVCVYTK